MLDVDNLSQKQVAIEGEIGTTTFTFEKMMALKAWKLALSIRQQAGEVLAEDLETIFKPVQGAQRGGAIMASLTGLVLKLPTEFVLAVQDTLWDHTYFSNRNSGNKPLPIKNADDAAFEGHDPSVIGEVLVRALAVNFTSSFRRIEALLPQTDLPTTSPSTPDE